MKIKTAATILVYVSGALLASGEDEAAKEVPPVMAGYQLKHTSSASPASTDVTVRAPFWPIGYVHLDKPTVPVVEAPTIDAKDFSLTSVMVGPPGIAVINGRMYGEGEFVRMKKVSGGAGKSSARSPRVRVMRIVDGSVVLEGEGQRITVTLKRDFLRRHEPSELSTSDDE